LDFGKAGAFNAILFQRKGTLRAHLDTVNKIEG
jgi:hypothetical protein